MKSLMPALFFALLVAPLAAQEPTQPKQPVEAVHRYNVTENREDGLVVEVYQQEVEHWHIPGGSSRTGGGGGKSGSTIAWKRTNKEAWIPHNALTQDMELDQKFTARVLITGKTHRAYETAVLPIHHIRQFVPDPLKKPAPAGAKPEPPAKKTPIDPFAID